MTYEKPSSNITTKFRCFLQRIQRLYKQLVCYKHMFLFEVYNKCACYSHPAKDSYLHVWESGRGLYNQGVVAIGINQAKTWVMGSISHRRLLRSNCEHSGGLSHIARIKPYSSIALDSYIGQEHVGPRGSSTFVTEWQSLVLFCSCAYRICYRLCQILISCRDWFNIII